MKTVTEGFEVCVFSLIERAKHILLSNNPKIYGPLYIWVQINNHNLLLHLFSEAGL